MDEDDCSYGVAEGTQIVIRSQCQKETLALRQTGRPACRLPWGLIAQSFTTRSGSHLLSLLSMVSTGHIWLFRWPGKHASLGV